MSTVPPQEPRASSIDGGAAAPGARAARPVVPLWKRPLYALVVLVAAAAAAEGLARLFVTEERLSLLAHPTDGNVNLEIPDLFAFDADLFWVLRPNLRIAEGTAGPIRTNALGLRADAEVAERKSRPRVLCLGDSCTYGYGLSLEDAWASHLDESFESLNAGVPGYSSFQGVRCLARLGPLLSPDCVVVEFGANDVNPWTTHDRGRMVTLTDRERATHVTIHGVLAHSRFLAFVASLGASKPVTIDSEDRRDYSNLPPRVPLDEFRANILSIADAAPSAVFLAWPRRSVLDDTYPDPVPRARAAEYHRAVVDLAREGRRVVDVAEVIREYGMSPSDFYRDDVHATPQGSRAVRECVAAAVREALASRR
jgi:lysophospholipase L1-like esterase